MTSIGYGPTVRCAWLHTFKGPCFGEGLRCYAERMKTSPLELIALIDGEITAANLASRHGVTEQEILGWRAAFVGGMKAGATASVAPRWPRARWFAALAVVGTVAFAQLAPMTTFTAGNPALASEINANFAKLQTWLEQKVGPVNSNNITTPGSVSAGPITSTGAITGASLVTAGNLSVSGDAALGAAGRTLTVTGTVAAFGPTTTLAMGSQYTAGTDGFVSAYVNATGTCNTGLVQLYGIIGGSEFRQATSAHGGCNTIDYPTPLAGFMMPVRKGETFQVLVSGAASFTGTFIPLGK